MHSVGILHCNIHPVRFIFKFENDDHLDYCQRNIFVGEGRRALLTVGSSLDFCDSEILYTSHAPSLGSAPYVAPESYGLLKLSRKLKLTQATDVYPFGVTMYEVCIWSYHRRSAEHYA